MRLAYTTYGTGYARLVIYRSEKERTSFIVRFANPLTGSEDVASFTAFAPMIHVGPAMLHRDFTLESWKGNEKVGECQGAFVDGLQLSDKSGYFEKAPHARPLVDRETISASRTHDGPGLQPTEIVLLSRKWEKIHQLVVHSVIDGQKL